MTENSIFFLYEAKRLDTKWDKIRLSNYVQQLVSCKPQTPFGSIPWGEIIGSKASVSARNYINVLLKQHEGYFGTDLIILNRGQITRATPEPAPHLQNYAPHQREDVCPSTYDLACKSPNTRRTFSGIGFRTWNPSSSRPTSYD
ncbi:hypothetical protein AVEN_92295-1 [Araneus ventricosus]|uniref:Uncharacterized protein n=1 Tax=Araneus ventricosus TaxID=182803 RepID=A0A4Y2AKI2_ARAVE|nr:hypothetical protein AVEN_92295-1 [Araneus ventricosus]